MIIAHSLATQSKLLLLSAILMVGLAGALVCSVTAQSPREFTEENQVKYHPSPKVRVVPDLVYARYGKRALRLDLYLPIASSSPVPGVIVLHGGGWSHTERKRFAPLASALAERGVAAASIEYRTQDIAPYPGAVQDVKAAIRWMRANAKTYRIAPDAIGTMGGSSGAYLALMAGITNGREFEGAGGNGRISSRVQAVVAMAPPTDLPRLGVNVQPTVAGFLRATLNQRRELWTQASPMNHIGAGGPPVLLLHSREDEAVLPDQSSRFADLYREAGSPVELVLLDHSPHAFWSYDPWFEETIDRAAKFFRDQSVSDRKLPPRQTLQPSTAPRISR